MKRIFAFFVVTAMVGSSSASATVHDQAKRLYDRLAGVQVDPATSAQMETLLAAGNAKAAALIAIEADSFYTVSLRNWFSSWTNVAESAYVDLNDFSATAIGLIRDDLNFDQVLYGDVIYVGNDQLVSTVDSTGKVTTQRFLTPYAPNSNQHYIDLENQLINPANLSDTTSVARTSSISLKQFLQKKQQSTLNGITDAAGVLTTWGFGQAYYSAGTNRRAIKFALINFLCMDISALSDTSRSDFRVRRDVDRSPGGNSNTYKTTCVGCHAGMDALGGAFAYFDFVKNQTTYTPGSVVSKYNKNSTVFPAGYVTTDDSWLNLWTSGPDASVGWNGSSLGNGAHSWGQMLSSTTAFSQCMAQRVFTKVCLRPPNASEQSTINTAAANFSANGIYSMKTLFANMATLPQCMGD